jgi:DNA-directed RNA polymerase specialized sigma24 family protein
MTISGDPFDDRELVARIAAGEERAFVIAYDRHAHFVYGAVLRFLGDREAAAEVAQDAFLALWRRARQFDAAAGSLLAWLLGIARNRAIDRLRSESRRPMRGARCAWRCRSTPRTSTLTASNDRPGSRPDGRPWTRASKASGRRRTPTRLPSGAGSSRRFERPCPSCRRSSSRC